MIFLDDFPMIFLLVADVTFLKGSWNQLTSCSSGAQCFWHWRIDATGGSKRGQSGIVLPDLDGICKNMISYVYTKKILLIT